jgi:hypothetical protein
MVDGRMALKWTLKNLMTVYEQDVVGSGCTALAGFCEHGNEPSGCLKCKKFLDQLNECHFHKVLSPWR